MCSSLKLSLSFSDNHSLIFCSAFLYSETLTYTHSTMVGLGSPTFQNITAPSSSYIEWKYKRLNYMKNIFSGPDFVHSTIFIHTPLNIQLASQPSESSVSKRKILTTSYVSFLLHSSSALLRVSLFLQNHKTTAT